jgi:mRNA-degrading endonuclease RelE of RelBE toxin-antitoxin system
VSTDASAVYVELSRAAERDLRKLSPPDHRHVATALMQMLAVEPMPANADDKALAGRSPWRRLRVDELRILYRPLNSNQLPSGELYGRRVARIIHRGQLQRAVNTLP